MNTHTPTGTFLTITNPAYGAGTVILTCGRCGGLWVEVEGNDPADVAAMAAAHNVSEHNAGAEHPAMVAMMASRPETVELHATPERFLAAVNNDDQAEPERVECPGQLNILGGVS